MTTSVATLLGFLVNDMLVAPRAVLLPLHALRMDATVLRGEVVAVFAVVAGENDFVARHVSDTDVRCQMSDAWGSLTADIRPQLRFTKSSRSGLNR